MENNLFLPNESLKIEIEIVFMNLGSLNYPQTSITDEDNHGEEKN